MYDDVVTVFNYHEKTGSWYTTVFSGADLHEVSADSATAGSGITNSDSVELIIHVSPDKVARTDGSEVQYLPPRAYSVLDDPNGFYTFKPETDFFTVGDQAADTPIIDDDYDEGYYHALNDEQDGVYMITSAAFFSLLPHFEIGGR